MKVLLYLEGKSVLQKSGIGRETHKSMLDAYTQMKNIYIVTKEEADGLY